MSQRVTSPAVKRVLGYSPFGNYNGDVAPFDKLFTHKKNIVVGGLNDIDCLILWGGTDIHPSYYGEKKHSSNGASDGPSPRDEMEWKAMLYCKANDIPMIGICRGAQFMCAFAGGSLAQDVDCHNSGDHLITTYDKREIWGTSVHHQMMNPFHVPHEMLAWTTTRINKRYRNGDNENIKEMEENNEPEIVYFPEIRALAIQGHPEYHYATPTYKELCVELVEKFLFKD